MASLRKLKRTRHFRRLEEHASTYLAAAASLAFAGIGVALLFLAESKWLTEHPSLKSVVNQLGGLIIPSVALYLFFELGMKRSITREAYATAGLKDDVEQAGLVKIISDFNTDADWDALFAGANRLDIYFAYARTWRATHTNKLSALARTKSADVRVVLPDPESVSVVNELARRFETTPDKIKGLIIEAHDDFKSKFIDDPKAVAGFRLWYYDASPLLTYYSFGRSAVLSTYKHRPGRSGTITLEVRSGGDIFSFIESEFESITANNAGPVRLMLDSGK